MKKKLFAIILVGVMALSFTACGGEEKENKEEIETQSDKKSDVKNDESEETQDTSGMSQAEYMESGAADNMEDGYEKVDSINIDAEKSSIKYEKFEITTGDSGQDAIILYFDFLNKDNDTTSIRTDFDITVFQNGVSCSPLMTTRENESIDNENKNVLRDGKVNVGLLYELQDLESPVKIRVENTTRGEVTEMFFQQQELNIIQ